MDLDLLAVKPQTCLSLALTIGFGLRVALQELESLTSLDSNSSTTMMDPYSRALWVSFNNCCSAVH